MDWMTLLSSMLGGGGEKPGQASQQMVNAQMGGLAGLTGQLGGMGNVGQPAAGLNGSGNGQNLSSDAINSLLSLFQRHSNALQVNPRPVGNWQEEMM